MATKIDLVTQVFNILRPVNGGTGINDFPLPVGHVGYLFSDGVNWEIRQIMNDTLLIELISEVKAMRQALTALACEGGMALPQDFDPARQREQERETQQ